MGVISAGGIVTGKSGVRVIAPDREASMAAALSFQGHQANPVCQ